MPKFSIGDTVEKSAGEDGVVVVIFTNADGEPVYGVNSEGTLQFVRETRLVSHQS
jgi:hypothetical protein